MAKITPDSVQDLLTAQNIGFSATEMPHGRAFRLEDGAILNVYASGKCVWQGKETASRGRLTELLGEGAVKKAAGATGQTSAATNKVFIVYGHDVEAREQLELLLRRMKLEPVILQNLPIGGQTIIEKLETNLDVRYACVLLTPDDEGRFSCTLRNPSDRPRLLLIQLQPNRGKHMSNPDQGGQQNQGGQHDQKPGQQQQQKPGQGGQQGDQKPGQQEQQK